MPIPITRKSNAFNSLPLIIQRLYSGSPLASKTSFEYTSPNYTARLDLFNSCSDRFTENLPFFDITMCYCCDIEFFASLRQTSLRWVGKFRCAATALYERAQKTICCR